MNKKILIANVLAGLIVLSLVGGFIYTRFQIQDTCSPVLNRLNKDNTLCISTTYGVMIFELYPDAAPSAVKNIKQLANDEKFYDELNIYRVVKDFVAQGGLQQMRGDYAELTKLPTKIQNKVTIGEKYKFDTEANFEKLGLSAKDVEERTKEGWNSTPNLNTRKFEYGAISFANTGAPNTNSTEFFIVTSKDANSEGVTYLNGRFTYFGKIIQGDDVLQKIIDVKTTIGFDGASSKPIDTIEIFEIRAR